MKIQCNVCEVAEANVLCCADEAALCWSCDEKVHAANKLASKHQRVSLSASSSPMPKCDICQETVGYFFCLEDRALLCRKCDVAIHTANTFVSGHRRFLLTGVKVGLEPTEPGVSASSGKAQSSEKISETESRSVSRKGNPMLLTGQYNKESPVQVAGVGDFQPSKLPLAGGSTAGSIPQWQFDEYLGLADFNQNYGKSSVLLGWFAGKEALALESLDDEEIVTGVSTTISSFLSSSHHKVNYNSHELSNGKVSSVDSSNGGELKFSKVLKTQWGTDPLFLGSYSYVAVGSSGEDLDTMAVPLPKNCSNGSCSSPPLQILFAGEATHRTHYSTTHGAYFSGLREANRLLQHYHCNGL